MGMLDFFCVIIRINAFKIYLNFLKFYLLKRGIGIGFCTKAVDLNNMPGNCNFLFINC